MSQLGSFIGVCSWQRSGLAVGSPARSVDGVSAVLPAEEEQD